MVGLTYIAFRNDVGHKIRCREHCDIHAVIKTPEPSPYDDYGLSVWVIFVTNLRFLQFSA